MLKTIYLDHNATTPVHPEALARLADWAEAWGNSSSIHWAGRQPKTLIREARQNLARLLGVEALELIFTGGGSESNNLALKGLCGGAPLDGRDQILISAVEHPSVYKTARALAAFGYQVETVPVGRDGALDLEFLARHLNVRTALVSIMLANNETGHVFPVREVADRAHAVGAWVHCDAVQGLGKIPLNLRELGVDLASLSGHKFYALKGCGVLYVRRGINVSSLIHGGGQERGRRAGTENTLAIASLGHMAAKAADIGPQSERLAALRDRMEERILASIPGADIHGRGRARVPNTSSLTLSGVDGETLMMNLDVRGFAVSTGAACSAGNPEPSPTLLAMGYTREEAQSSLRVSLGWGTCAEDVERFVTELAAVVVRLRGFRREEMVAHGL